MSYIVKLIAGIGVQTFGILYMDATRAEGYILFLLGFLFMAHIIESMES